MDIYQHALDEHKRLKGKISTSLRALPDSREALSTFYSPGVAEVSRVIAKDPTLLSTYTWTNNLVAVISDGSAVLGLGDIGPEAAMPVMEGKAMLFKHFSGVDAVPIILDVHTPDEIVSAVKAIAKSFGGINLEDISAPKCFEIEERLKAELDIPVMHDDQHGTAIVVLAGLINAMKVVGKDLDSCKVVLNGVGAAGIAVIKLLKKYAPGVDIVAVDSKGLISTSRIDLTPEKQRLISDGIISVDEDGDLTVAVNGRDIFIGVSKAGLLSEAMVKTMSENAVIFALANPEPEILPNLAKKAGASIIATGRSDFPNQVNNVLAFPGIFRGALDNGVKKITDDHKIAAAKAIASLVPSPTADEIIPNPLNPGVAKVVAAAIR